MKLKIAFIAGLLLAPSISLAMGCEHGSKKQAMSCADGTTYDSATHSCLPINT